MRHTTAGRDLFCVCSKCKSKSETFRYAAPTPRTRHYPYTYGGESACVRVVGWVFGNVDALSHSQYRADDKMKKTCTTGRNVQGKGLSDPHEDFQGVRVPAPKATSYLPSMTCRSLSQIYLYSQAKIYSLSISPTPFLQNRTNVRASSQPLELGNNFSALAPLDERISYYPQ